MSQPHLLLLLTVCLAAADPAPGTYQSAGEGQSLYLTLDDRRVVLQNAAGQSLFCSRVVRESGG
jgi:hypothetical protein